MIRFIRIPLIITKELDLRPCDYFGFDIDISEGKRIPKIKAIRND